MSAFLFRWLGLPSLCLLIGLGAGWKLRGDADAASALHAAQGVIKAVQRQSTVNETVAVKAQAQQDRIVYRTQTLVQEVPKYVTIQADSRCVIPLGFGRLLNDAASGNVSAAPSGPGQSADTPSTLDLVAVGRSVVSNYGAANLSATEVNNLLDWAQASGLMKPGPPVP